MLPLLLLLLLLPSASTTTLPSYCNCHSDVFSLEEKGFSRKLKVSILFLLGRLARNVFFEIIGVRVALQGGNVLRILCHILLSNYLLILRKLPVLARLRTIPEILSPEEPHRNPIERKPGSPDCRRHSACSVYFCVG